MIDWLMNLIGEEMVASEQEKAETYRRWRDGKPRRIIDPATMSEQAFMQAIHDLRNQPKTRTRRVP